MRGTHFVSCKSSLEVSDYVLQVSDTIGQHVGHIFQFVTGILNGCACVPKRLEIDNRYDNSIYGPVFEMNDRRGMQSDVCGMQSDVYRLISER